MILMFDITKQVNKIELIAYRNSLLPFQCFFFGIIWRVNGMSLQTKYGFRIKVRFTFFLRCMYKQLITNQMQQEKKNSRNTKQKKNNEN